MFADGSVQFYHEINPRDVYWTDLKAQDVLKGRESRTMREALGEATFAELLDYLRTRP